MSWDHGLVCDGETPTCQLREVLVQSPPLPRFLPCMAVPWVVVHDQARQRAVLFIQFHRSVLGEFNVYLHIPLFIIHVQRYWLVGGAIWTYERVLREIRSRHRTYISKVIQHPSKVVEIQIKKEKTTTRAGQYIFISCPEISYFQWHPFTLTRHVISYYPRTISLKSL